ncbi:MAG TPA: hypothetical protein VGM84_10175 [Steroidobacteraceae bacterium]|jgi:hypothetical protein
MHARSIATAASAFLISVGLVAGVAQADDQAQVSASQLQKDSNKKTPAAADASLAKDHAEVAKKNATRAKDLAKDPKAKAAADSAAKQADVAAKEAAAAAKEADHR